MAETVSITDPGGYPIVTARRDDARHRIADRIEQGICWGFAFPRDTFGQSAVCWPALLGNEAFEIQWSTAVFVGDFPAVVDDAVVGGVRLSDGNGEHHTTVGPAALAALRSSLRDQVTTEADRTL